jgi:phage antirepressor YoqD-like protein
MNNDAVLTVVQETVILGKKIQLYGSVEAPLFKATDVADWIEHTKVSMMLKSVEESEKVKVNNVYSENRTGGNGTWMLTEDGLYEVCMQSRKPVAKEMKKEIKQYLKSIRLTGAAIPEGREQEMVNYYFSGLSSDLQGKIVNELIEKNKELQTFYDDLMSTEGVYSMNTTAKELRIGRNTLFAYLRGKEIMFYQDGANVPYQRFMNQGLFRVIESPCADGQYRPTTYATKKGLDYIRKLLRKDGYYREVA